MYYAFLEFLYTDHVHLQPEDAISKCNVKFRILKPFSSERFSAGAALYSFTLSAVFSTHNHTPLPPPPLPDPWGFAFKVRQARFNSVPFGLICFLICNVRTIILRPYIRLVRSLSLFCLYHRHLERVRNEERATRLLRLGGTTFLSSNWFSTSGLWFVQWTLFFLACFTCSFFLRFCHVWCFG